MNQDKSKLGAFGLRATIIWLVMLTAIWSVMSSVIPEGRWHLPINIVALLATLWWMGRLKVSLKRFVDTQSRMQFNTPVWLSSLMAIAIWAFVIVGVRSAVAAVLGG
jgi:hypothetical protein